MQNFLKVLVYSSPLLFPLYLVRFSVAGVPFNVLELFVYALFVVWLAWLFKKPEKLHWEPALRYYWWAALLLFIGTSIGVVNAPAELLLPGNQPMDVARTTLGIWKGWVVMPILYFAVISEVMKTKMDVRRLLGGYVASAVMVSVLAYFYAFFADGLTYDMRLSGIFESANYLSLYIGPAIVLSVYFLVSRIEKAGFWDYANTAGLAVLVHAMFFTQSYAAILAIFGAFFLTILSMALRSKRYRKKAITGVLMLVATFLILILTQINTPKFQQFIDLENRSSSTVRLEIYEAAVGLIKIEPLWGIGPGLFQARYQTNMPELLGHLPMEWNIPHPHNIFLAFWLNAGLLGLIAFVMILIAAHRRYTYPLMAFWVIILHGFFDTPFWKNDLAMIFWLIVASILVLQVRNESYTPQSNASGSKRSPATQSKKRIGGRKRKPKAA